MRWACVVLAAATLQAGAAFSQAPDLQKKLDAGTTEVTFMGFERAVPYYEEAMKLAPEGGERWQQAVFGLATSKQHAMPASEKTIGDAQRYFLLLIAKAPTGKYTPRAMMDLGRIAELVDYAEDKADREKAREWYGKAMEAGKGTDLEGEATLRIAGTYIQTYEKDQINKGLGILRDYVQTHPKDPLLSAMWQYMGEMYFYPLEDYARSLECYKKADAVGLLEEGREGPIYWRMAIMADRYVKDRDTAIEYYKKIITKTPTSGKAYEAQLALRALGVEPPRIELFDIVGGQQDDSATTRPAKQEVGR